MGALWVPISHEHRDAAVLPYSRFILQPKQSVSQYRPSKPFVKPQGSLPFFTKSYQRSISVSEIEMTVVVTTAVVWDVTPCSLVASYSVSDEHAAAEEHAD